jgi:hypothetical protein
MMKLVPPHQVLPYFYRCVTVAIEYYDGWCPCLKTPGSVLSPGPVASRQTMASARRPRTRARTAREPELSHEAQKEAGRGEIAERDDRTAIRINGMNEPTAGADQPNEHRQAEEAILAAIEKGVPLSLACCRAGVSYESFHQWRKENPEFESALAAARIQAEVDKLLGVESESEVGEEGEQE